mmetsp:Transcript_19323/g.29627  ORF Transcript_19323/g.29627 Transcript_19323/m.29627 type:complete len:146 (+) Transcript_19323:1460-1897(+)
MCKNEQCSNWLNRPLRPSQIHYGLTDGWVLMQIAASIEKKAAKAGKDNVIDSNIKALTYTEPKPKTDKKDKKGKKDPESKAENPEEEKKEGESEEGKRKRLALQKVMELRKKVEDLEAKKEAIVTQIQEVKTAIAQIEDSDPSLK